MPYLTPPRVKLGTIACERTAAAVRRAARSPSAAPHVRGRSFQDLRANSKVGSLTTRESPPTRSLPKRAPLRDGLPFAHGRAALLKRSGAISPLRRGACGGIVARTTDRRAFAMRRGDTVTRITRRMNVSNLLIEKLPVLQLRL